MNHPDRYTPGAMDDQSPSTLPVAVRSRTALLRSAAFLGHETGTHPENPRRLPAIDGELTHQGLLADRPEIAFRPATIEQIERVHDSAYVDLLERATAAGGGWLDADTLLAPDSLGVARLAAGAAVAAVDAVLDGAVERAFALVRPPGHHATPNRGMGFCLLNSVAIAAEQARWRGLERVAILDWDVHHGNGTQDAFWSTDRVLFCSLHQSPLYPDTGAASERGEGAGAGYTLNRPLPPNTDDATYLAVVDAEVMPALLAYRPELVIVSAGFDAHAADPLAGLRLTEEGFAGLAHRALDLADRCAGGRLVLVLEGGYDPAALGRSVAAVVRALDGLSDASEPTQMTERP